MSTNIANPQSKEPKPSPKSCVCACVYIYICFGKLCLELFYAVGLA